MGRNDTYAAATHAPMKICVLKSLKPFQVVKLDWYLINPFRHFCVCVGGGVGGFGLDKYGDKWGETTLMPPLQMHLIMKICVLKSLKPFQVVKLYWYLINPFRHLCVCVGGGGRGLWAWQKKWKGLSPLPTPNPSRTDIDATNIFSSSNCIYFAIQSNGGSPFSKRNYSFCHVFNPLHIRGSILICGNEKNK